MTWEKFGVLNAAGHAVGLGLVMPLVMPLVMRSKFRFDLIGNL